MHTRRFLLALLLGAMVLPACAADCVPRLRDGWVRLVPGGMPMHAGFARIENPCPTAVVVTGASSPAYASVTLHESRIVDGVSRMRPVPRLSVPAGGVVTLAPGGLHLMLMQPRAPVQAGTVVDIALQLEDGRVVRGAFPARAPAAE